MTYACVRVSKNRTRTRKRASADADSAGYKLRQSNPKACAHTSLHSTSGTFTLISKSRACKGQVFGRSWMPSFVHRHKLGPVYKRAASCQSCSAESQAEQQAENLNIRRHVHDATMAARIRVDPIAKCRGSKATGGF